MSIAKCGLAIAIRYGARRRQFGPSEGQPETILLDYPAHQRRLMPLLANAYALDFAFKHLTQLALTTSPEDFRQVETTAAGLKAFSTWNTTHTLQTGREACGGEGYLAINRFAALKADSDIFTTFEGDNTVLMQLVAKNLLTDYAAQFKGKRQGGSSRAGPSGKKLARLDVRAGVQARHGGDLRAEETQAALFRLREERLLLAAGARLRALTAGRPDDRLRGVYLHAERTARAGVRARRARGARSSSTPGIAECPDAGLRPMLDKLRDLFALSHLEKGPRVVSGKRGCCPPRRSRDVHPRRWTASAPRCAATRWRWWMPSASRPSAWPRPSRWIDRPTTSP